MCYILEILRPPPHDQSTNLGAMKEKVTGGGSVGDGASRWSTRQASLFYRRQNNRSFSCRRIPSLFSDVKVLTDSDLIKESQTGPENMVDKSSSTTKRPSASCDHKNRQGQVRKTRENSGRKASLSSQADVRSSKFETSLKRKSPGQDICGRPSKRKPQMVRLVSKGVQKSTGKKQTKGECKSPRKTEVGNGDGHSLGSKNSTTKSTSSCYKVLMTRPCSVPVLPVETTPKTGQQRSGTVLVLKKVLPSSGTETNILSSRNSSVSLVTNLSDKNVNNNIDNSTQDQDQENQLDNTDFDIKQKSGVEDKNDESIAEMSVGCEGTDPICLTDSVASDLAADRTSSSGDSLSPQCGFQNQSKEASSEGKMMNFNSVSSNDTVCTATKESQTENVTIKRSARISERREKFNIANLLTRMEKSQGYGNSLKKSNLFKPVGPDIYSQTITASKALNRDISNSASEREMPDISTTTHEQQHPKHRRVGSFTKYTQRATWQLHPQPAPVEKIDPVSVGDIVWGKVHGHPWWPGKVLAISGMRNEESKNPWDRDAHVAWFGSNTSSIMHLHALQLFMPNFAKRHKRHKKGCYKVAVREAQEALQAQMADEN